MNIIIKKYDNDRLFYLKPDTSLNRDCNDYFCPETIKQLSVTPFIFTRINKAGKSIQDKFTERYYNAAGYGLSIGIVSYKTNEPADPQMINLLDNSTYLSNLSPEISEENRLQFSTAISQISKYVSLRSGDIVAVETGPAQLYERGERVPIKHGSLSFEIIF